MNKNIYRRVEDLRHKPVRRVLGLISGTSADGVSAAITDISGSGPSTSIKLAAFSNYPYPPVLREEVFKLFTPRTSRVNRICEMNFVLGDFFADCVIRLAKTNDIDLTDIDLIGSHGQTIYHSPLPKETCGYSTRSTLQIGEPAVIAARTGIPTVADFRKADIGAGGQGAPLTPYLDYVLYRDDRRSRVFQNIGGIANLTYLPADGSSEDVIAFDTGPGNMLIDAVVRRYSRGTLNCDEDGKMASKGKVNAELLTRLLSHPYFSKTPPKTTGREMFGEAYARKFINKCLEIGLKPEDAVATASALTVETIARAYEHLLPRGAVIDEVFVSGGGARNRFLMESLRSRLRPISIQDYGRLGIPSEVKEAVLMALLANEHVFSRHSNIPRATGAKHAVVLGQLYPSS